MAVKYPGITPPPLSSNHRRSVLRITESIWLLLSQDAVAERRDKPEVSSGPGTEKRRGVDARVTAGLTAVLTMNGAALCLCLRRQLRNVEARSVW